MTTKWHTMTVILAIKRLANDHKLKVRKLKMNKKLITGHLKESKVRIGIVEAKNFTKKRIHLITLLTGIT